MASEFKVVFECQKLQRDLKKASGEAAETAVKKMSTSEKLDVGEAVVDEMKKAISKGISPIKDAGRFPAYLYAKNKKSKIARQKAGINDKEVNFGLKYPFSVQNKFPDKKVTPVNLKLSGEFLKNLKSKVLNSKLYIGFFKEDGDWYKYEQGHREGVHGQPKRPIVPGGEGEEFSQSVYRRLVKALQEVFDKKK